MVLKNCFPKNEINKIMMKRSNIFYYSYRVSYHLKDLKVIKISYILHH